MKSKVHHDFHLTDRENYVFKHTISIESEKDKAFPIGELEAFVATANDAGTGVHAPVDISIKGGIIRISVEVQVDEAVPGE